MAGNQGYSRRDLETLRRTIESASPDAAIEYIAAIPRDIDPSAPVEAIIQSPDDVTGLTVAGGIRRYQAWKARGAMVASMTSDKRFLAYFDLVEMAREHLGRANQIAPDYGLAAGLLASLSIDGDPSEKTSAEHLIQNANGVPAACYCDVVTGWAAKWGGSQDEMWMSLRRLSGTGRLETLALVPRCHWEQQLYTEMFASPHDYVARFGEPAVRPDLQEASDAALALDARQTDPALLRFIDGWFAFAFFNRGADARSRQHLKRLGRHVDPSIWQYGSVFLSPGMRFRLARARAGLF